MMIMMMIMIHLSALLHPPLSDHDDDDDYDGDDNDDDNDNNDQPDKPEGGLW